ncbi:acyltransferase [Weissella oryzae SG25]|uniref:Acyltransferase n=1 Tax=Weissella oryzae (strain DSM 25784 / JCM 18191 / LMG 30913 / SG25) TaxID=1329250 RepID=A0A069CV08_WEIOS|nr:acyltransferase family protein [Weissella oryzae]GAK31227.1 acyltransferase [Weissella oryzae SG25]
MEKKRLQSSRYITGFDGLRTLAVVGVIVYHLLPNFLPGGFLGVIIFFSLTGYLITDLLRQERIQNGKIAVKQFYQRRIRRLFPLLFFVVSTSTIYIAIFQRNLLVHLRGAVLSSLLYVNNFWQILQGTSYFDRFGNESPFKHIWALSIEGQFYLLWPIVFIVLSYFFKGSKGNKTIFNILFALSIISAVVMAFLFHPGTDPSRVYYGSDTRAFAFLLGGALAFVWPSSGLSKKIPSENRNVLDLLGLGSLILMVVFYLFVSDASAFVYQGGMYLFSIFTVLLILVVAHPATITGRLLTTPFFKYIGSRSYGIYLWQFPIMVFFEAKVDVGRQPILYTLIEIGLILLASELSYRYIEQPLKNRTVKDWWLASKVAILEPGLQKARLRQYTLFVLFTAMFVIIALPAAGDRSSKPSALQNKIKENSDLLKKKAADQANSMSASSQADGDATDLTKRFGLSQSQVQAAANLPVTAIGDSVVLASAPQLQSVFPKMQIDAQVGRQLYESYSVLDDLKHSNQLADTVLVSLGTNGTWTDSQFNDFMNSIGSNRQVYWVDIHAPAQRWQNQVNTQLAAASKQYKNLHIISWNEASSNHPDWFYDDQVHPNSDGELYYTQIVAKALLDKVSH